MTLANAHVYLEAAGHVVVGWLWLEQAARHGHRGQRLPRGQAPGGALLLAVGAAEGAPPLDLLESLDRTVLDTPDRLALTGASGT